MDATKTPNQSVTEAVSDMDEGQEVTLEITGKVVVSEDGTKSINVTDCRMEDESSESAEQEKAEKPAALPPGMKSMFKAKPSDSSAE